MSFYRSPFDPLQYLNSLRLDVRLDTRGRIVLDGLNRIPGHKRRQAWQVVKIYDRLLRMQLDAPSEGMRPSVRKLLAQGRITVQEGRYVRTIRPVE